MEDLFLSLRDILDNQHNARERIVKASRDITAASKKVIFALHRIQNPHAARPKNVQKDIDRLYKEINERFESIKNDLADPYKFYFSISPGIQEYIEALAFDHYLTYQKILSYDELPKDVFISFEDYVLGLFDMTGELMRYAVSRTATTTTLDGQKDASSKRMNKDEHENKEESQSKRQKRDHATADKANLESSSPQVVQDLPKTDQTDDVSVGRPTGAQPSFRVSPIAQSILSSLQQFNQALIGFDFHTIGKSPALKEIHKKVSVFESSLAKVEQATCDVLVNSIN